MCTDDATALKPIPKAFGGSIGLANNHLSAPSQLVSMYKLPPKMSLCLPSTEDGRSDESVKLQDMEESRECNLYEESPAVFALVTHRRSSSVIPIKLTAFFYVAGIPEAEETANNELITGAAERDNFRRSRGSHEFFLSRRTPPVKMKYIYGELKLRKELRIGTINGD
ncbi:unnamed protein product [Brassica oleracea var. botrytis]|uniref:(rape) hypothetical protein n=1 Tax=Brassica napus TaxID=3708 RepID=A0A816KJ88_BRANA|nr:unnamed protein product [Brassica napus]